MQWSKTKRDKSSAIGHMAVASVAGYLIQLGGWLVVLGGVMLISWFIYTARETR